MLIQPGFKFAKRTCTVKFIRVKHIAGHTSTRLNDVEIGCPMVPRSPGDGAVRDDLFDRIQIAHSVTCIVFEFTFPNAVLMRIIAITRHHLNTDAVLLRGSDHLIKSFSRSRAQAVVVFLNKLWTAFAYKLVCIQGFLRECPIREAR